jgi:hypothetical protein
MIDGAGSGEIDGVVAFSRWEEVGVGRVALWDRLAGPQDSDAKPKEPHVVELSCVVRGVPEINYKAISTCKYKGVKTYQIERSRIA